jgi:hypothetical protein
MTRSVIRFPPCPYPNCRYEPVDNADLGQHLLTFADDPVHRLVVTVQPPQPLPPVVRPPRLGVRDKPRADQLVPGLTVSRYTEPVGTRQVQMETPCCSPTDRGPSRKVVLDLAEDRRGAAVEQVVCPACRLLWWAWLDDQGGEDFTARFQLVGPVGVAHARFTYTRPV